MNLDVVSEHWAPLLGTLKKAAISMTVLLGVFRTIYIFLLCGSITFHTVEPVTNRTFRQVYLVRVPAVSHVLCLTVRSCGKTL